MTAYKRMPGRGAEVPSLRDSYTSVLATRHCRAGLQIVAFLRNSIRAETCRPGCATHTFGSAGGP